MKGKLSEEILIDYFYNELPEDERREVEKLIANDPDAQKKLDDLKAASALMQKWEVPEQKMNFVFVQERSSLFDRIKEAAASFDLFRRRPVASFAYGLAGIFLLLSLTNFSVTYDGENGGFTVQASVFGTDEPAETGQGYEMLAQQLAESQQRVLDMVDQIMIERERHQREMLNAAVTNLTQSFQRQRENDLEQVGMYLTRLSDETDRDIDRFRNSMFEVLNTAGIEIKRDDF